MPDMLMPEICSPGLGDSSLLVRPNAGALSYASMRTKRCVRCFLMLEAIPCVVGGLEGGWHPYPRTQVTTDRSSRSRAASVLRCGHKGLGGQLLWQLSCQL